MESAEDAKYFSDLDEDYATAEVSFGQFFDGDARANDRLFAHNLSCNAAAGCNCSFARLNCSEITALTHTIQTGITAVPPESKQHNVTVSSHEKNVLGIISQFFGAVTARNSTPLPSPRQAPGS